MNISWRLASLGLMLTTAPLPAQDLKKTQRAIRERILTEAGNEKLIYSRVDFNNCAVTIQARTPRGPRGEEERTTYLFHATSLNSRVVGPGPDGVVRLVADLGRNSIRRVTQFIDSVVAEKVSMEREVELRFGQQKAAVTVATAFGHLVKLCLKDNPFKVASQ